MMYKFKSLIVYRLTKVCFITTVSTVSGYYLYQNKCKPKMGSKFDGMRKARLTDVPQNAGLDIMNKTMMKQYIKIINPVGLSPTNRPQIAQGAAFAISEPGCLLTNCHVALETNSLVIQMVVKNAVGDARDANKQNAFVVFVDPFLDLAFVATNGQLDRLPVVFEDNVEPGEEVITIGNPIGCSYCVNTGVVSIPNRSGQSLSIGTYEYITSEYDPWVYHLGHTAPGYPGFSGGPVFNSTGKLVGITWGGNEWHESCAIRSPIIKDFIARALRFETEGMFSNCLTKSLGIVVKPYNDSIRQEVCQIMNWQLSGKPIDGLIVWDTITTNVSSNEHELKKFDVIVSVNGNAIKCANSLINCIMNCRGNDVLTIKLMRGSGGVQTDLIVKPFTVTYNVI